MLFGAMIGAFMGVLFTPKTGKEMRKCLFQTMKGVDKEFMKVIDEIEEEITEFQEEKNLKDAKIRADNLIKKSSNLVDAAVKKGNKNLHRMANDVHKKASIVTDTVLDSLE